MERMRPKNLRAFRIEGVIGCGLLCRYRSIAKFMLKELLQTRKPAFHRDYLAPILLPVQHVEANDSCGHGSHGTETLLSIGRGTHRGQEPLRVAKGHPIRQTERPSRSQGFSSNLARCVPSVGGTGRRWSELLGLRSGRSLFGTGTAFPAGVAAGDYDGPHRLRHLGQLFADY